MLTTLTVVRYPPWMGWAGFLSMALFRIPLWFRRSIPFWKLMGSGRNGTFSKIPDWRQWAVLMVHQNAVQMEKDMPAFFNKWWLVFHCEKWTLTMEAIEGHGLWDGLPAFGELPRQSNYEGPVGILTRATIRLAKLKSFWSHVDGVAAKMADARGLVTSLGIGEAPWIKQATFSIWESRDAMKDFAYRTKEHTKVIRKTKADNWYSEEMFIRFRILHSEGSLQGKLPFQIKPYFAEAL
ncbi:MAG: spheroidene monooxygenase [Sediminibacterium sp.]